MKKAQDCKVNVMNLVFSLIKIRLEGKTVYNYEL
jgi:hypothetical protein